MVGSDQARSQRRDRPVTTAEFVLHLVRKRFLATRKFPSIIVRPPSGPFSIDFHAEQQPNPESRVQLGAQQDRLGMPRLRVDWRYSPIDIHTVAEAFRVMAEEIARSGCGRLDYRTGHARTVHDPRRRLRRSSYRDSADGCIAVDERRRQRLPRSRSSQPVHRRQRRVSHVRASQSDADYRGPRSPPRRSPEALGRPTARAGRDGRSGAEPARGRCNSLRERGPGKRSSASLLR